MATIRNGNKSVLLVVDVQVGVVRNAWNTPRIIQNIVTAVEKARADDIPVIWVQHTDDELLIDSPDWQLVLELLPAEGEIQINKNFNSGV
jgi:nicotinamidase-related amidase